MEPIPGLDQLVGWVNQSSPADLNRVRTAVTVADELGSLGDSLVTHFVQAAREAGCSWSQIGAQLGVSKQAAQQGFAAPAKRRFGRRTPRSTAAAPFERYSDPARRVVGLAQAEAVALAHHYVGTEHLLLGLIAEGEGVAVAALRAVGIDADAVRRRVEEVVGRGTSPPVGQIPFTPRTNKVLELAVRQADKLKHDQVGTEHLLLGLVNEGEGLAAQMLVEMGADLRKVRKTVTQLLGEFGASLPRPDAKGGA